MKKLILVMLTMLLVCAAGCAFAEEPVVYTYGEYRYVLLEDGTAEICGCYDWVVKLVIPEKMGGHTVTAIGNSAFYGCGSLVSVTIPDTVTSIGNRAFARCDSLKSITLPNSITNIGTNPFMGCSKLTKINVSPDHPTLATINGVLFDKQEKKLVCYPYTFTDTSYVIPQGIRSIGDEAFYECGSLTSVTIPDSVTSIGDRAFYFCDFLTSITIPDSVTSIGDDAFGYCKSLTSATIPDSVTSIGDGVFGNCSSLTSVTIPDSVTAIGDGMFGGCALTSITIPDSVTTIGDEAFAMCGLTSITIPDSVTSIGDRAFHFCYSLTSITIPDSVTAIGINPFTACSHLTEINVSPNHPTLETIDGVLFDKVEKKLICYPDAFKNTSYVIPQGIRSIGDYAFFWDHLTSVTIPDSVTSIGNLAFDRCDTQLIVPHDSYAEQYCKDKKLTYSYPDSLDWLNN